MTKRGSDLVVETLAAINISRWSFPAVGSFSVVGGLAAVGSPSTGGSTVARIFLAPYPNFQWYQHISCGCKVLSGYCRSGPWSAGGGGLWIASATLLVRPAEKLSGVRAPLSALVVRLRCWASKGRCWLW